MENDTQQENLTDEEEILSSYYDTLNPRIQNLLASDEITSIINTIADEAELTEEETETFGNEIHLALLGFGNPINFSENLANEGFPAEKAPRVADAAQSKIFSQVKSELEELYTEKATVSEKVPNESPTTTIPTEQTVAENYNAEPLIKTENATREPGPVHTLDRETLLHELESPEPFNVSFTPQKTVFEENILSYQDSSGSIPTPVQTNPSLDISTPPSSHDLYREKPAP